jgi:hypothetical protein
MKMLYYFFSAMAFTYSVSCGAQDIVVSSHEPPAAIIKNSFSAQCGESSISIEGFGGAQSLSIRTSDGVEISVPEPLRGNLSLVGGVYRFSATCSDGDVTDVRYYRAEVRSSGVTYAVGHFSLSEGRLIGQTGESVSNEETFWYR